MDDRVSVSTVHVGTLLISRLGEGSRAFGGTRSEATGWKVVAVVSTAAEEGEGFCKVEGSILLSSTTLGA